MANKGMSEGINTLPAERDPRIRFKQRLDAILFTHIQVETISSFADTALTELNALNAEIVTKYREQHRETEAEELSGKRLEDAAYAHYDLPNLEEIFDRVIEVQRVISSLDTYLDIHVMHREEILVPPDAAQPLEMLGGDGSFAERSLFPRLLTLAYILSHDFSIETDRITFTRGITTPDMVRNEPYIRVNIPDLNRIVYVCNEEGNASYIFDAETLAQLGITIAELDKMTKIERNALISKASEAGKRIVQSMHWRTVMGTALREPFGAETSVHTTLFATQQSEFRERQTPLPFEKFETSVRIVYENSEDREINVSRWYRRNYIKHSEWPPNPERHYKEDGWKSWPELVGREKVTFLSYDDFMSEIRKVYREEGESSGVSEWYKTNYKQHPGWPAHPNETYRRRGWEDWSTLLGRERVTYLPFDRFVSEVLEAYQAVGEQSNVHAWYRLNYKRYSGWPPYPNQTYANQGWKSWPELVGREKFKALPYEEFVSAVRDTFKEMENGRTNLGMRPWYDSVYKSHAGWPAAPDETYKKGGWVGWPELMDRDRIEFLPFNEFMATVRLAYQQAGSPPNTWQWYADSHKRYSAWPASPSTTYNGKGWKSWPELVGREKVTFLSYDDFMSEIRKVYREAGSPKNIQKWYAGNYKEHKRWPSIPITIYKDAGLTSWSQLLDRIKGVK